MGLFTGLLLGAFHARAEPDVVIQNRTFASGEAKAYWAGYTLQSMDTVVVQSGAQVRFSAGSTVLLRPGFRVDAGGLFSVTISASGTYDPGNYYNGGFPTVAPLSPYIIYGAAGAFNPQVLDIAIWNAAGTAPLVNAPVMITVEGGEGWLALNTTGAPLSRTLEARTDDLGTVRVYFKQPPQIDFLSQIRVIAGNSSQVLRTQSYDGATGASAADDDGDGLPNSTETLLGGNPSMAAVPSGLPGLLIFNAP